MNKDSLNSQYLLVGSNINNLNRWGLSFSSWVQGLLQNAFSFTKQGNPLLNLHLIELNRIQIIKQLKQKKCTL